MKKVFLFSIVLALSTVGFKLFSNNENRALPNWIDIEREKPDGKPPVVYSFRNIPQDFRVPAEYEPVQAVVIGWRGYSTMLKEISQIVTNYTDASVWNVSGPSSLDGVSQENYFPVNCRLDTVWMRDYGPFGISRMENQVGVVDTVYRHYQYRRNDDRLPACLAHEKNFVLYGTDLVFDGGNFLIDSVGNLFMTERTYFWNSNKTRQEVDHLIKTYFNAKLIHVLEFPGYPLHPSDGTGHIDMFVKLLSDNTVLISTSDEEPFKSNGQKAINYFESIEAPDGKPYRIIEVKGVKSGRTWYTYTNSLIVNNVVIMPSYRSFPHLNEAAKRAYEIGMENVIVKEVNSDSSISSGGSIHCVTQTIPAI